MKVSRFITIVPAILCGSYSAYAQEIPTKKPAQETSLTSMEFSGAGQHEVELDGYGICLKTHWAAVGLAAANHPYVSPAVPEYYNRNGAPIAYVRGSIPSLNVRFNAPDAAKGEAKISGELNGEFHVGAEKPVVYQASVSGTATLENGEWVASALSCSQALPNQIGYCEKLTIRWTLTSADGARSLSEVSLPAFYLLRQTPQKGLPLLHTPVDLACRAAAGLEDDAKIIDAVWQPFAKGHVPRARDGQPLAYYGTYHSTAGDLRGLLMAGSGQCTTWAYLQHCALGAMGIDSDITGIFPTIGKGRILVKNWAHLEGTKFITSGSNGICDTTAAGDDVQVIAVGTGRPNTLAVDTVEPVFKPESLKGDDFIRHGYLLPGPDGILQTQLDEKEFIPVVPLGFGYAQQRGYQITDPKADIRLEGDDTLARDAKGNGWVMTGANGILETSQQDGLKLVSGGLVTVSKGTGSTGLNLHTYLPRRALAQWPRKTEGDDAAHDNAWISTGNNGIAETVAKDGEKQIIPLGQGMPNVPVIGPGPNGVLDTKPMNDDTILDESEALRLAGEDFPYLPQINIWPLEGVGGQQATNPPPSFPNHVILTVGGKLYDPSYGTGPFPDHNSWEKASLFGVGTHIADADGKSINRGKVRTTGQLSSKQIMLDPN